MIDLLTARAITVSAGGSGDLAGCQRPQNRYQGSSDFTTDTDHLKRYVNHRQLRRLDHFSQMALLGACLCAETFPNQFTGPRCGLIIASAYGPAATTFAFLDTLIDYGDQLASPTIFANSVNNAAAAHIASNLAITGPCLSLNQGHKSLVTALQCAATWLDQGRVDCVLCGLVEEINQPLLYGFDRCPEAADQPGEGAVFFPLWRPNFNYDSQSRNSSPGWRRLQTGAPQKVLHNPARLATSSHRYGVNLCPQKCRRLPLVDLRTSCGQMAILDAFYLALALHWAEKFHEDQGPDLIYEHFDSLSDSEKGLTGMRYSITNLP